MNGPLEHGIAEDEQNVTELLEAWGAGDPEAAGRALPLIYGELRSIARSYFLRERRDHTLQATALVHEAYVRVVEQSGIQLKSRAHFVGLVAHVMRRVLVDYARERNTAKRGGRLFKVTLVEADRAMAEPDPELLDLDRALSAMAERDPLKARIVELKFFGGLSIEETAEVLETSAATVVRQWRRARAWLYRQLAEEAASRGGSIGLRER